MSNGDVGGSDTDTDTDTDTGSRGNSKGGSAGDSRGDNSGSGGKATASGGPSSEADSSFTHEYDTGNATVTPQMESRSVAVSVKTNYARANETLPPAQALRTASQIESMPSGFLRLTNPAGVAKAIKAAVEWLKRESPVITDGGVPSDATEGEAGTGDTASNGNREGGGTDKRADDGEGVSEGPTESIGVHAYCQNCGWYATPDDHDHEDVPTDAEHHVRIKETHTVSVGEGHVATEARLRAGVLSESGGTTDE